MFNLNFAKTLAKKSLPFGALGAVISIYLSIDILIITFFSGSAAAGLYSAAYKIAVATTLLSEPFAVALFPAISKAFNSSHEKFKTIFSSSMGIMLAVVLPISMLLFLFPGNIISLLYGNAFAGSSTILAIISFMPVLLFLNLLMTTALKAAGKQNVALLYACIAVAAGISLDIVFLQYFGIEGVAVASMLTQSLFFLLCFASLPRPLK